MTIEDAFGLVIVKRPAEMNDDANRYLRILHQDLAKLLRVVESQEVGKQGLHQGQFDRVVMCVDAVHTAMVRRGYLPSKGPISS